MSLMRNTIFFFFKKKKELLEDSLQLVRREQQQSYPEAATILWSHALRLIKLLNR